MGSNDGVHLLPVAPTAGNEEVGQLEMSRGKLMTGMRDGALRILDIFLPAILNAEKDEEDDVDNPSHKEKTTKKNKGLEIAKVTQLKNLVQQYYEEIEYLRTDLDKLRAKTFPSFLQKPDQLIYPDEK